MASRVGAFGLLIGAALGALLLVPTHGSAQDSLSVSCAEVYSRSSLEDLTRCVEQGHHRAAYDSCTNRRRPKAVPRVDGDASPGRQGAMEVLKPEWQSVSKKGKICLSGVLLLYYPK